MSIQILFSKEDPLGTESSVQRLFWHTDYIKNRCRGSNNTWGSNNDIDKAKIYPRGKAYWKIFDIHLHKTMKDSNE